MFMSTCSIVMLHSSRGSGPDSRLEWSESARRATRLPKDSGSGPVSWFWWRRSSCSSERLPMAGGSVPVIALRANETYSRLVRLSQMSSGMIPYSPAGEIRASSADEAGSCWPGAGARAF